MGGGGRLLSLKSVFSISKWVMPSINDLVLTESNVRPGKLPSAETCAHADSDRSRACVSPVKSRQGRSGRWLWSRVEGEQFSALSWDHIACAAALAGRVLPTDEAD